MAAASAGLAVALLAALPGTAGATTSSTTLVLSPTYAKALGFSHVVQAAKTVKVTSQKGCTTSTESVYEDAQGKTGLVSETLVCSTRAAAAKALASARTHVKVDPSHSPPKQLGPSAFVTSTEAPEYLMVWQAGTRLGVTAIDVDVAATSAEGAKAAALSAAESSTLTAAALHQNSLY